MSFKKDYSVHFDLTVNVQAETDYEAVQLAVMEVKADSMARSLEIIAEPISKKEI